MQRTIKSNGPTEKHEPEEALRRAQRDIIPAIGPLALARTASREHCYPAALEKEISSITDCCCSPSERGQLRERAGWSIGPI